MGPFCLGNLHATPNNLFFSSNIEVCISSEIKDSKTSAPWSHFVQMFTLFVVLKEMRVPDRRILNEMHSMCDHHVLCGSCRKSLSPWKGVWTFHFLLNISPVYFHPLNTIIFSPVPEFLPLLLLFFIIFLFSRVSWLGLWPLQILPIFLVSPLILSLWNFSCTCEWPSDNCSASSIRFKGGERREFKSQASPD